MVAKGQAMYRGIAEDEQDDVEVVPVASISENLRQRMDNLLPKTSHASKHRAYLRWKSRARQVKKLVSIVKFETHGFDTSVNDRKALSIAAKRVIDEHGDGLGIANAQKAWYKRAVCAMYYHEEEDDSFLDEMGTSKEFSFA